MKKIALSLLLFAVALILHALAGCLGGAVCGWLVGLFFEETFLGILACIGIKGFALWQIGAFLGFIASFFKPNKKTSED